VRREPEKTKLLSQEGHCFPKRSCSDNEIEIVIRFHAHQIVI